MSTVRRLLEKHSAGFSEFLKLAAHELAKHPQDEVDGQLSRLSSILSDMAAYKAIGTLGHLYLDVCDKRHVVEHRPRVNGLLKVLALDSCRAVRGLVLEGKWTGLDLRGIEFADVNFINVAFAQCEFDCDTEFRRCRFDGELTISGSGFADVFLADDCVLDSNARRSLQRLRPPRGGLKITREDVQFAIKDALRKFKGTGGKLGSISAAERESGAIGRSKICLDIWRALKESGVVLSKDEKLTINHDSTKDVGQFLVDNLAFGRVLDAIEWAMCLTKQSNDGDSS